ncbi:transaldolase [Conexibacter arvalis]|uniref:Transaldolase n=1 Tax=Conexibacter arvalis TaxID=912552 RepID=A0A840IBW5_9ACTN|nr:transaldolase [Conexibacter arvalis]MBB4662192.1 transaldolase [Conexibacter arvalis]
MTAPTTSSPLHRLSALGQSIWIDFLSRAALRDGTIARLIEQDAVVGATSNPTIFQKAIAAGDAYDDQLRELRDADAKEAFWALATRDVREACDLFRPIWDGSAGRDGYVSIEVDPGLAYDTLATFREVRRLRDEVDRPNVLVKIPATKPGLAAIEDATAAGISINVTLIFSLRRYDEVVVSYLRGLERLVADGGDPARIASVASFFVSRIDTEADRRLEEAGGPERLKGELAIANARLAYQRWRTAFTGERWEFLTNKGATPQRVLWASTSVKNPAYRDTRYVEELIGPDTIDTMPLETLDAFRDHGRAVPRLELELDGARRVFAELAAAGIDYDDVTDTLEREGVEKFAASFDELLEGLSDKRAATA